MSIKRSDLWQHFSSLQLTENMRVDLEEKEFAPNLLNVGNGDLATNFMGEIELPNSILSKSKIIEEVFGDCLESGNNEKMKDRATLAPLNKDMSKINSDITESFPGNVKSYQTSILSKTRQKELSNSRRSSSTLLTLQICLRMN